MASYPEEEAVLVKRAVNGDAVAYGKLYQSHSGNIYRYIRARVSNHVDAEDLTSQVFLKAWEALPGYQDRGLPFSGWLYRIAHNTVVDYHRRQRLHVPLSSIPEHEFVCDSAQPVERLLQAEETAALNRAISRLPSDHQNVINLRFEEGLDHEDVGRAIKKSAGASRSIQYRAIRRLGELLDQRTIRMVGTIVTALLLLLAVGETIHGIRRAVPGSALYRAKRTIEVVRLASATTAGEDAHLHVVFAEQRLSEALVLTRYEDMVAAEAVLHEYVREIEVLQVHVDRQQSTGAAVDPADYGRLASAHSRYYEQIEFAIERSAHGSPGTMLSMMAAGQARLEQLGQRFNESAPGIPALPPVTIPSATMTVSGPSQNPALILVPTTSPTVTPPTISEDAATKPSISTAQTVESQEASPTLAVPAPVTSSPATLALPTATPTITLPPTYTSLAPTSTQPPTNTSMPTNTAALSTPTLAPTDTVMPPTAAPPPTETPEPTPTELPLIPERPERWPPECPWPPDLDSSERPAECVLDHLEDILP